MIYVNLLGQELLWRSICVFGTIHFVIDIAVSAIYRTLSCSIDDIVLIVSKTVLTHVKQAARATSIAETVHHLYCWDTVTTSYRLALKTGLHYSLALKTGLHYSLALKTGLHYSLALKTGLHYSLALKTGLHYSLALKTGLHYSLALKTGLHYSLALKTGLHYSLASPAH